MKELLDRMRELVEYRRNSEIGTITLHVIDDDCLESLIYMVREHDRHEHDLEIQAAYRLGKYETTEE